jgi:ABC-type nitrate/sulfonate/bicarbonate transport system permease component
MAQVMSISIFLAGVIIGLILGVMIGMLLSMDRYKDD